MALTCSPTADKADAYTLRVTSCNASNAGTADEGITFNFCQGGSYCDSDDYVVDLPSLTTIGHWGATVEIPVSPGFEPTTMDLVKGGGSDAWCDR